MRAINDRIAAHATGAMMTMWCVYLFLFWALLPALWPQTENLVQYVSQSVVQLVALPLIMVGGAVLSRDSDERSRQDHVALMEELTDIREILADVRDIKAAVSHG